MSCRVLVINVGSTSTKVAIFDGGEPRFRDSFVHDQSELAAFKEVNDQLPYRRSVIMGSLERSGLGLSEVDAVASNGGGLVSLPGGTYRVNATMLAHARAGLTAQHPATLGCQLANEIANELGVPAFVVNPPDLDELDDVARVTGLAGVERESRTHALNEKEVAHRYAASTGRRYEELNLITAHIGGGVSVSAHRRGRMVESNDTLNGDGPMSPNRSGALPASALIDMCFSGKWEAGELHARVSRSGGLLDHLGTSDLQEVAGMVADGDDYAWLVYRAMAYQVGKAIGGCAAVLHGEVDGIILTGGIVNDAGFVQRLTAMVERFGPIAVYPGELELEALAAGACRVLNGEEEALEYTGVPVWQGIHRPAAPQA